MHANTEITGWFNKKRIKHMNKEEKEEEDWKSVNTWTADGSSNAYAYKGIPATPVFTRV